MGRSDDPFSYQLADCIPVITTDGLPPIFTASPLISAIGRVRNAPAKITGFLVASYSTGNLSSINTTTSLPSPVCCAVPVPTCGARCANSGSANGFKQHSLSVSISLSDRVSQHSPEKPGPNGWCCTGSMGHNFSLTRPDAQRAPGNDRSAGACLLSVRRYLTPPR